MIYDNTIKRPLLNLLFIIFILQFSFFNLQSLSLEVQVNAKHDGTVERILQTVAGTQLGIPQFKR